MGDVKKLASPGSVTTLWIHECNRVFADRLINTEDRTWFLDLMKKQIDEVLPASSLSLPRSLSLSRTHTLALCLPHTRI